MITFLLLACVRDGDLSPGTDTAPDSPEPTGEFVQVAVSATVGLMADDGRAALVDRGPQDAGYPQRVNILEHQVSVRSNYSNGDVCSQARGTLGCTLIGETSSGFEPPPFEHGPWTGSVCQDSFAPDGEFCCAVNPRGGLYCWSHGQDSVEARWVATSSVTEFDLSYEAVLWVEDGAVHSLGVSESIAQWYADNGPALVARFGYAPCLLRVDGTIACDPVLDNGEHTTPPPEGIFTDIKEGDLNNCGLHEDGAVECWNNEDYAGGFSNSPAANPRGRFTQIDVTDSIACGVTPGGCVACWRNFEPGENYGGSAAPTGRGSEDHPLCSIDELEATEPTDSDFF